VPIEIDLKQHVQVVNVSKRDGCVQLKNMNPPINRLTKARSLSLTRRKNTLSLRAFARNRYFAWHRRGIGIYEFWLWLRLPFGFKRLLTTCSATAITRCAKTRPQRPSAPASAIPLLIGPTICQPALLRSRRRTSLRRMKYYAPCFCPLTSSDPRSRSA